MNGSREDDCPRVSVAADLTCQPDVHRCCGNWPQQDRRGTALYRQATTAAGGNGAAIETGDGEVILFPSRSRLAARAHWVKRRVAARMALAADGLLPPRVAGGFGIFMYHRVSEKTAGVAAPTWNVTPRRFRQQLAGLLARGYHPWPLRQVLAYHRSGEPVPPRTFVVTFDDGYECIYRQAWPILKELAVPATIFLPTAYLDSKEPLPFDDWPGAGSSRADAAAWRPLSTAQCAEMLAGGLIDLGTHSHVHALFFRQPEALHRDLAESLSVLQRRFGLMEAAFAFPFGFADHHMAAIAHQAGVLSRTVRRERVDHAGERSLVLGPLDRRRGRHGSDPGRQDRWLV